MRKNGLKNSFKGLVWFREDLRIHDNLALFNASRICKNGIIGLYIIDRKMWKNHHIAPCRISFILQGVEKLTLTLQKLNIPLIIIDLYETKKISDAIFEIIKSQNITTLFFNRQYEVNEQKRDLLIEKFLHDHNIACEIYQDQLILPQTEIRTQQNGIFKIFTAYQKSWKQVFKENIPHLIPPPKKQAPIEMTYQSSTLIDNLTLKHPKKWVADEKEALKKLHEFLKNKIFLYERQRDYPSIKGTSELSPYLSAGIISAKQCFLAAYEANHKKLDAGNKGAVTWMNELIWRDFYKYILIHHPRISMHKPYKLNTEKLTWNFNQQQLNAWKKGETGIPIIDAAMRQLNQTGWMHNRLRMIVAMFFTKNLFFDWRIGEQYFMEHLIDGDLAANNGGWQWCASTGTDAAPYFRIFNPITQSERFDPKGEFIRTYCPELSSFDNKTIHDPHARAPLLATACGYPLPIINLKASRLATIAAFKKINSSDSSD